MSDSRVGGFGVVGACCLLLVKFVSLNSLPASLLTVILVLMPVVSRWAMVYAVFAYPYAKPSGLGKGLKQQTRWFRFTIATLITIAVAVFLLPMPGMGLLWLPLPGLAVMLGIWGIVAVMATYLKRKFSGLTGDSYGAVNEVAEVSVLIIILVLYRTFPTLLPLLVE